VVEIVNLYYMSINTISKITLFVVNLSSRRFVEDIPKGMHFGF